ncbi:predicted protein [Nematostella vectensis]|uniref:Angiotensin-converting enzyme n=1 Tax=Nematostella vectensis TaxID=45351 RepID=A7RVF2_NEMVE|nr:predicted protein [Nematostella vectensis]|eukprot:XP_001636693.1 predicted protein [Nematostella vectensis]
MWTYGLVGFLFFFVALQTVQINGFEKGYCKVSLPQYVTPACSIKRKAGLYKQQKEFKLNAPSAAMPYARLAVSTREYPKFVKDKPMLSSHLTEYAAMVAAGRKFQELYKDMTKGRPEEMTYRDFLELNKYMRTALEKAFGHKMRLPSEYEPFQMDVTKYLSDKYFTEQRLAGANPLGLQQVTLSDEVSTREYPKFVKDKPMLSSHLTEYAAMVAAGRKFQELYKDMTKGRPEEMTYRDFLELNKYMRTALEKAFGHKMRLPSEYEPFQMDVTKYLSDKYFTEQRLAGANPLGLQQTQCAFTSSLGTFRYDRLLDYASFLEDRAARRVVYRNFCRLNELVEPLLIRINNRRLKDGHLAYPYFIPRWLPNGIQT